MIKYVCDRCGEEFISTDDMFRVHIVNDKERIDKQLEICKSCANIFFQYTDIDTFQKELKSTMKREDITQQEVADVLETTIGYICKVLMPGSKYATTSALRRVEKAIFKIIERRNRNESHGT